MMYRDVTIDVTNSRGIDQDVIELMQEKIKAKLYPKTRLCLHYSLPDSSSTNTKSIPDRASIYTKDGDLGVISITKLNCAAPMLIVDRLISDGFLLPFVPE